METSRRLSDDVEAGLSVTDNKVPFEFTIQKPQLWWTWNLGKQPLYTFRVIIALVYIDSSTAVDYNIMDE